MCTHVCMSIELFWSCNFRGLHIIADLEDFADIKTSRNFSEVTKLNGIYIRRHKLQVLEHRICLQYEIIFILHSIFTVAVGLQAVPQNTLVVTLFITNA